MAGGIDHVRFDALDFAFQDVYPLLELIDRKRTQVLFRDLRERILRAAGEEVVLIHPLSVDPSGPAAEAGIQPGDVIVEANRQPVRSGADLQKALAKGGQVVLLINRQGRTSFVTITP